MAKKALSDEETKLVNSLKEATPEELLRKAKYQMYLTDRLINDESMDPLNLIRNHKGVSIHEDEYDPGKCLYCIGIKWGF